MISTIVEKFESDVQRRGDLLMMKCVGRLTVLIALLGISSCCSLDTEEKKMGLSGQEKQFISRFENEPLIHAANQNLKLQRVNVTTVRDIVEISGKNVAPVVYSRLLSTKGMDTQRRKKIFIAQMLPHILIVKYYLDQEKEILERILDQEEARRQHSPERHIFIKKLLAKHNAENTNHLLQKLPSTLTGEDQPRMLRQTTHLKFPLALNRVRISIPLAVVMS
jgi:hypothetical protein